MDHIGIDVHKQESQISILAEGGELIEQRVRTEPERFAVVLGDRPRARIVIEAATGVRGHPERVPVGPPNGGVANRGPDQSPQDPAPSPLSGPGGGTLPPYATTTVEISNPETWARRSGLGRTAWSFWRPATVASTIASVSIQAGDHVSAAAEFLAELRRMVEGHRAVNHPFLRRFAQGRLSRWQIWGYASQHYHLVSFFPAYLEAVANRTPDPEVRRLVGEILEEEYMRPQSFERSHTALYRRFLRAVGFEKGDWEQVALLPATRAFVQAHLDITWRSWLLGLGAVGPGHEWAIPLMFRPLVTGIARSLALDPITLEYFHLHIEKDVEHGRMLEECLRRWSLTKESQEEIRRGAEESLTARAAFWSSLDRELFPVGGEDTPQASRASPSSTPSLDPGSHGK